MLQSSRLPALYDPSFEHDACGVGFIADLKGRASHSIVDSGLSALERLEHRGATGAEADTGDGAGILLQIPDRLFRRECALGRIESPEERRPVTDLPAVGRYAVGLFFGSQDAQASALAKLIFAMIVRQEGLRLIGWRRVPTDNRRLGETARSVEPTMDHVFVALTSDEMDASAFERKLYVVRKRFSSTIQSSGIDDRQFFHVASLSSKTLVYKGMLTPAQLRHYFGDLDDSRTESALALFHSRFSTNTFPSWELAHPYRFIAHNGEINTLRGNVNWMRAREALLASPLFGADLEKLFPIVSEGLSDSASLDRVLELLVACGRSLPHALMMLMPEAWENDADMSPELRAFYGYHACLVEPWDGPACVCFTDGDSVGATLDRNGLRPGRFWVTDDERVIFASETGVIDVPPEHVVEKGKLGPGRMLLVDLAAGRIVRDHEIKERIAGEHPYGEWLADHLVPLESLPEGAPSPAAPADEQARLMAAFGFTDECLRIVLAPMAIRGEEAIGSMGNDAALAVLSSQPRPLFDSFKQLFAQVTNPPLDAVREKLVTSLSTAIGPENNLLDPRPESARLVLCERPFFDAADVARFKHIAHFGGGPFGVTLLDMTFPASEGEEGARARAARAFRQGRQRHREWIEGAAAFGSRRRCDACAHSVAPRGGRAPQLPGARAQAHARDADRRNRRGARGASRRPPHRLRRERGFALPRPRCTAIAANARARSRRRDRREAAAELPRRDREGRREGDEQNGDQHRRELPRRADLRGHRPLDRALRALLHAHSIAHRGRRRAAARS